MATHSLTDETTARTRLFEAAIDLFNRKGYAATSVSEIVAAAGVTKPVLYYHFGSKEGLFLAMMSDGEQFFREVVERDRTADGTNAAEAIRRFGHDMIDLVRPHLHFIRIMHAIYYGPPQGGPHIDFDRFHRTVRQVLRDLVKQGIAEGHFRRADPVDLAWPILGALSVCIETMLCHPEEAVGHEGFDRILDNVFRGILSPPGIVEELS